MVKDRKPNTKKERTMELNRVKLIYFSATGTTKKVLESIAEGIAVEDVEHINLTIPERAQKAIPTFSDELVIIGAPVYGGRLPVDAIKRFQQLKADNTLAIVIVLYGNREFDDALLELKHLAAELGFHPIAGGAFIGEHSFSSMFAQRRTFQSMETWRRKSSCAFTVVPALRIAPKMHGLWKAA